MRTKLLRLFALLFATTLMAQTGHILQGVGAVNMSMGGAATGQPLDISGALQWNPAAISSFDDTTLKFDLGLFFSSPELSGSLPANMLGPGAPGVSGITEDDRGVSPLPNLAYVWSKEGSKHTFGASAFGISGFGVTFPEESNSPADAMGNPNPDFNQFENSNPINYPQAAMGFGHIESDYMLLQVGLTWAYEITDKLSIGIQPNFNYASLELAPNPTSGPNNFGYPNTDKASALGFGGQVGLFYDSGFGLKLGASYKTNQTFKEFEFDNTFPDGSSAKNKFQMDYPAILSLGIGYSAGDFDLALDFRRVDYENTEGFEKSGWTIGENGFPTGSVEGFGWDNISIVSAGLQFKGINKLPLRVGYTYSSNPIPDELTFFNIPATAVIKHAYQFGLSYEINDTWKVDGVYHYGDSAGSTTGNILSPMAIAPSNPLGAIPGSSVSYDMTTSMIMFGVSYTFNKKEAN